MNDLPDERPKNPPTGGPGPSSDPHDFDNNQQRDALAHKTAPETITPHHDVREAEFSEADKERTAAINQGGGMPLTDGERAQADLPEDRMAGDREPESVAYPLIDASDGTVLGAIEADTGAGVIETEKWRLPVSMINTPHHGQVGVIFVDRETGEALRDREIMTPPILQGMNQGLLQGLATRSLMERHVVAKDAEDRDDKVVTLDESYRERQNIRDQEARTPRMPRVQRSVHGVATA